MLYIMQDTSSKTHYICIYITMSKIDHFTDHVPSYKGPILPIPPPCGGLPYPIDDFDLYQPHMVHELDAS